MALMERIATLLRANVNDLVERAEDPEKLLKQLVLDMENHMLQLKTQVAMALADQHLLERKAHEQEASLADWQRKAELAVSKGEEALARAALERAVAQERTLAAYRVHLADQAAESEALRSTYTRLQGKLAETGAQCDLLAVRHRRTQLVARATEAQGAVEQAAARTPPTGAIGRVQARLETTEVQNHAACLMLSPEGEMGDISLGDRFAALEGNDRVEQMLAELKDRQGKRMLAAG